MGAAGARLKWPTQEIDASGVVRINKKYSGNVSDRTYTSLFIVIR
jgi:hypothetical protein